jgi:crotonobetainyl-CoA:carnitine CoA-transferase CaiB-like acyl-CoA transferase
VRGPAIAPLSTVSVLRLGDDLASRVAAHWLGELGADVREPRDPSAGDPDVLVGEADKVTGSGSTAEHALTFSAPTLGPDGATGSATDDDALWRRSGLGVLAVALDRPEVAPPAIPEYAPGSVLAGIAGCVGVLGTLVAARRGGAAARTVDVDRLEVLAALPMQPVAAAQLPDVAPPVASLPPRSVPTADGAIFVGAVEPRQWRSLLKIVGLPDLAATVRDDGSGLLAAETTLVEAVTDWAATRTSATCAEECQGEHVPVVAIRRPHDVRSDPHLRERGFFPEQPTAAVPIRLPWLATPAAHASMDGRTSPPTAEPTLPLAGVRVLDLTWAWAGPFATTLLADLGAEVVNVEWTPRPSNLRMQRPFAGGRPGDDRGGWWSANQRGKYSVGVNLKSVGGVEIVEALAAISDVVVENFSPGVVDRLGIGPDALLRINPRLVYASMSAFGQTGPASHYVGYGTQIQAASGAMFTSHPAAGQPWMTAIPLADPVSGLAGATAVLAHLLAADETGRGVHLDVSELESMCWSIVESLAADTDVRDTPVVGPAATPAEVLRDRWLCERDFWVEDRTPAMAGSGVRIAAPVWTFDGHRPRTSRGAPVLFGDTDEVLTRLLGVTPETLADLHGADAVR